ncbi:hypothetical protein NDN01_20350 [Sphingomonas sp. QA11]|uniref:hypothetical protein n=1 Tax=Sphingomonas sp. QA11 TaxID=2950605 RepID=UPI00234B4011|nr:hypothetical protein [Sphingomonas sp. QA11]WCM26333.1 hypothetical protein NDN01_20350 [Sphingomonas sp. QA11]
MPADPGALERAFNAARAGSTSVVAQALRRRVPVHFGGMSDPFQPAERRHQVSLAFLRALSGRSYPTVISTKGELAAEQPYVEILAGNPNTVVQFSLVSVDDRAASLIEPSATPPSRLLRAAERLTSAGVKVAFRLQPYLPSVAGEIEPYVRSLRSTGACHLSIEHLKVPLERTENQLIELAREDYAKQGAVRDGREYVLPRHLKLGAILEMREVCGSAKLAFGCADNEFQYLSDGFACCSGVDQFDGFENIYRFQMGFAVRSSIAGPIRFEALEREWRPTGSIDRYLNSRSRLGPRTGETGTVEDHIRARWNNPSAPGSPLSFAGVVDTDERDDAGYKIYAWDPAWPHSPTQQLSSDPTDSPAGTPVARINTAVPTMSG